MLLEEVRANVHRYMQRAGVPICQHGIRHDGRSCFAFFLLTRSDELDRHIEQLQRKLGGERVASEIEPKWLGPPHDYGALRIVIKDNPFHHESDPHDMLVHLQLEFGAGQETGIIYRTAPVNDPERIISAVRDLLRERERAAR